MWAPSSSFADTASLTTAYSGGVLSVSYQLTVASGINNCR